MDTINIVDYRLSKVKEEERARIRWLIAESDNVEHFFSFHLWNYENMKELSDLVISSTPEASEWGLLFRPIREHFEEWFSGVEGWKCPEIRIVEKGTGIEMNLQNFQALYMSSRGRGRRGGGRSRGGHIGGGRRESALS